MSQAKRLSSSVRLRARVTCPHCWQSFPPDEFLWISAHPDLLGDPLLGEDAQQRFLPTRFSVAGHAKDVQGMDCHRLACPRCHLAVPRAFLEMEPLFISILGAPSSGKSYFLASMTWQLRKTLRQYYGLSFEDADPVANQILSDYEETLFLNPQDDQLVSLPKTEKEGNLYESVKFGQREVWYPRPFVFSVQPLERHPGYGRRVLSRALCLYDNAGEHFLPGGETVNSPGTQHLALSQVLLFLFDPTQHALMRKRCRKHSSDPQMGKYAETQRQDQVLLEAANRIRAYSGLAQNVKYSRPLVVVVTKYDAWSCLTNQKLLKTAWVVHAVKEAISALNLEALNKVSDLVRKVLSTYAEEIVTAAESFSEHVIYIPVSALGRGPEVDQQTGFLGIRPRDVDPMWAEIPILYALNQATKGLVRSGQRIASSDRSDEPADATPPSQPEAETTELPVPRIWKETGS